MDMDTEVAQATKEVAAEQKASKEAETPTIETPQEKPAEEKSEDIGSKPDEELNEAQLAKREKNRQSHLNSKLAQMRRENRELKARIETPKETVKSEAPKPEDFKTWGEYTKAETGYLLDQKLAERDKKTEESSKTQAIDAYKQTRVTEVAQRTQEFIKQVPEYTELYNENQDFLSNLPPAIEEALTEADDATLAVYALMKEGKLEELENMSPYKIAMEIAKAEIRGKSYLTPKKVTNTPAPITAAKGNSSGGKPLHLQSPDELMKHFGF